MTRRWLPLAMVGLLVSLAACGVSGTTTAPTVTVEPTASAVPSTDAEGSPSSDAGSSPAGEPIDFVLLADSGGGGVATKYAARVSEGLGREVRVHDRSRGGATATDILFDVRYNGADDVAEAEIVVFYVHPGGFGPPSAGICLEAVEAVAPGPDYSGPSWAPGQTWDPPVADSIEDWQGYRDTLDQVYDEIWKARAGRPTILRAYGVWMPWLSQWRQVGIASECTAMEETLDQVRREAAEAAGAEYVSMLDVFNGPAHDEDPVEKGWISEDGMHLSEAGVTILVDALAAAGFEESKPPR